RKDLDYQTMKEYDRFEKGAANSNTSTRILQKQLGDPNARIIITTIQKLDKFIGKNKGHDVFKQHIVLIFDECHRSQFGDMHQKIIKSFSNYHIFGFTGTPIFSVNAAKGKNPLMRTTPQAFGEKLHTYTIVNAIRGQTVEELKKNLRDIDVLIVDDIQFIAGKDKTQEEFFHTFNSLYQKNKQIILSSDRHPNNIPAITERLKSRFGGGMIADINTPDYETRVAILKQKSEEKNIVIPADVLEYIANNIQKNVRELEGAVSRLAIYKKTNGKVVSLEDAKKLLKNIVTSPARVTNHKKIVESITEFYDIPSGNMFFVSRKKEFARPRQIAMYLLKKELKMSYSEIGRKFGGKDHTTVIHACQLIEKEYEENEKTRQEIELIIQRIY
ncbi:MAG: hypothetical protein EOM73_16490, partial [Bacteroidia bacterium]|nr:hypothetical protein [Bacteroidia bacterium]